MPTTKIFHMFCAVDQATLTTSDATPIKRLFEIPVFGDSAIFRFTCFENVGNPKGFSIEENSQLEFVVADRVAAAESNIAVYAHDAKFSVSHWIVFNRANGKVACELKFNSLSLESLLIGKAEVALKAELVMVPAGSSVHVTLCQFDMTVQNTLYRTGLANSFAIDLVPGPLASSSSSSSQV